MFKVTIFIVTVSADSSEDVPLSKIDEDLSVEYEGPVLTDPKAESSVVELRLDFFTSLILPEE